MDEEVDCAIRMLINEVKYLTHYQKTKNAHFKNI